MGRPFKLTDHQKREAIERRNQGETLADIARSYNVSPATISRLTWRWLSVQILMPIAHRLIDFVASTERTSSLS
jgi:hypothetical protein